MTDYDSPWKEALDVYFPPFLALLFPQIYTDIDWSRGYESLDKEFQQVVRDAEGGRRYVDKLVKVWQKDGTEQWVLIHIEIQTTRDAAFSLRMYTYHYRIFDKYRRAVASLAVMADDDPNWRPDGYRAGLWGCESRFDFPQVKLLDYAGEETALEASDNPFAQVLLAHLKAIQTQGDAQSRQQWKLRLVRGLYERGFSAADVRELFRLIDWLIELPPALGPAFWEDVKQIQEAKKMPFITTPERIGMEKGMEKGLEQGRREGLRHAIRLGLRLKFPAQWAPLFQEVQRIDDLAVLKSVYDAIETAASADELRRVWAGQAASDPGPR